MKCPICQEGHVGNRRRVGPTGRKHFNILVDTCYKCGAMFQVYNIPHIKEEWVRRYNERMRLNYENTTNR